MDNIVLATIVLILGLAVYKILRDKKSGSKCSSCPYASVCTVSNNLDEKNKCDIEENFKEKVIVNRS